MSETRNFTIGRGGLFRIPELNTPKGQLAPGEFLEFFRNAWMLNGKAVGDVDRGTQQPRAEHLVIPPTAEKPIAVFMDYEYRFKIGSDKRDLSDEIYRISKTSSDVLGLVPELWFIYSSIGLGVGSDHYAHSEASGWLVSGEETGDKYVELTTEHLEHLEHLGKLASDFVKLVS